MVRRRTIKIPQADMTGRNLKTSQYRSYEFLWGWVKLKSAQATVLSKKILFQKVFCVKKLVYKNYVLNILDPKNCMLNCLLRLTFWYENYSQKEF